MKPVHKGRTLGPATQKWERQPPEGKSATANHERAPTERTGFCNMVCHAPGHKVRDKEVLEKSGRVSMFALAAIRLLWRPSPHIDSRRERHCFLSGLGRSTAPGRGFRRKWPHHFANSWPTLGGLLSERGARGHVAPLSTQQASVPAISFWEGRAQPLAASRLLPPSSNRRGRHPGTCRRELLPHRPSGPPPRRATVPHSAW